jgi:hypothetical protein
VAITSPLPISAATTPPVITQEIAFGRNAGLAMSAAAKR